MGAMGAIYHFSPPNDAVTCLPLRPPPSDLVGVNVGRMNQQYLISRWYARMLRTTNSGDGMRHYWIAFWQPVSVQWGAIIPY